MKAVLWMVGAYAEAEGETEAELVENLNRVVNERLGRDDCELQFRPQNLAAWKEFVESTDGDWSLRIQK